MRDDLIDRLLGDWRRERPELDVEPMAVVGRVLNIGRRLEARANNRLKDAGVIYTDFDVLATLRRVGAPYRLTPTDLRESVLITSGAMTACLARLEKLGLVRRRHDRRDRRSVTAELTSAGLKLIDEAVVARFDEARDAVSELSAHELATLSNLLRRLGEGLRKKDAGGGAQNSTTD